MATRKNNQQHGLGRRKTAVAQVLLTDKAGEHLINKQPLTEYFATVALQKIALEPLLNTSQNEIFGLKAKVSGGGKMAQAGAIKLALARAIVEADEGFHKQLKDAGHLKRDPRRRERKKYGLKRARRASQFSKR